MPLFGPPNVEKMKARRDVSGLIKALEYKKDVSIRQQAALALGQIGDTQAVEVLIHALDDANVCAAAAGALGLIRDRQAVKPLIALITIYHTWWDAAEAYEIRQAVFQALGRMGDPRAVDLLINYLRNESPPYEKNKVYQAAARALVEIGKPAVNPLIAAVKEGRMSPQAAFEILEKLGWKPEDNELAARYWVEKRQWDQCIKLGQPAVAPLISVLFDEQVRQEAAQALVKIGAPAVEPLITILQTMGGEICQTAAEVLGEIDSESAIEPLISALEDKQKVVRCNAARALVAIYRRGRLNDVQKKRILAQRKTIQEKHLDGTSTVAEGSCYERDVHGDLGIGVKFPL